MASMRLQKYLSRAGFCSRRKGEEYISNGQVTVNGVAVTELGTKIDPTTDRVEVDGTPIEMESDLLYIALNKPKGYVTSCSQPDDRTVLDIVDISQRIYPIGRLDRDSTGLLLLTNDGRLHHRLSHPSFDHEKEYEVTVARPIPDGALRKMAKGLALMGTKTRPAEVRKVSPRVFRIVLREGRNRQIRRMVRKVGGRVSSLKRIRVSNIGIGQLNEGDWRYLTEEERGSLISKAGLES